MTKYRGITETTLQSEGIKFNSLDKDIPVLDAPLWPLDKIELPTEKKYKQMNFKPLYCDKGFTPYPTDLERYERFMQLPDDHRDALGIIGQKFVAKCHKMSQAGAFELVMAMSEFLDKERM